MAIEIILGARRIALAVVTLAVAAGPLIAQRSARPRPRAKPPATATTITAPTSDKLAAYLAGAMGSTSVTWWNGVLTPDYPHKNTYVKQPVYVDWTRKDLTWWIQWKTTTPAASARWQVSTVAFPQSLDASWASPLGLRASGKVPNVPPAGVTRDFAIDLTKIAPRPNWWAALSASASAKQGTSVKAAPPVKPVPASASRQPRLRLPAGRPQPKNPGDPTTNVAPVAPALPAALYMRIVTLDAKGNPITASNTGMLTFGPPKPSDPPPTLGLATFEMPEPRIVGWTPPQPYAEDVQCWLVATRDWKWLGKTIWHKGQKFNTCAQSNDDGFFEDLGNALGGSVESFVEIIEDAVDWASDAYNDIKKTAISTIVSGLKSTVGCGSECQFALSAAVDAGMAAMGVPPSIPNFDQLVAQLEDQGVEYLAGAMVSAAASQGVPVPQELAEEAVHEFIDQAKQKAASAGGSGGPLFVPDPDRIYRPAVLVVEFRNIGSAPTRHAALTITQNGRTHYADMVFHAPPLAKGESIRVPLFLTPVDDPEAWRAMLPSPKDVFTKGVGYVFEQHEAAQQSITAWKAKYSTGQLTFQTTLTNDLKMAAGPKTTCQAGTTACN